MILPYLSTLKPFKPDRPPVVKYAGDKVVSMEWPKWQGQDCPVCERDLLMSRSEVEDLPDGSFRFQCEGCHARLRANANSFVFLEPG